MPFTPFHFGPALLAKASAPRRVSFLAFATAQVVVDLETWFYLTRDEPPFHRTLHTFVFGALAAIPVAALARMLGLAMHRIVGKSVSHSLLDGIVHKDMRPFYPMAETNPLLGVVSWGTVELVCMSTGVAGGVWLVVNTRAWRPDA